MAKRDSKGRFLRGGGGGGGGKRRRSSSSRAIVVRSAPAKPAKRRRGRRRGGSVGSLTLKQLGPPLAAGAVLGYLVRRGESGSKGDMAVQLVDIAKKVPGQKTFGTAPAIGVIALAADRFVYRHRYLRTLGVAGLIVGAYNAGHTKDLKWVGGVGDVDDGMVTR